MNKTTKTMAVALMVGTLLSGLAIDGFPSVSADNKATVQQTTAHKKLLNQTMTQAKQGKLVASEQLGIGSTAKDITAKWGKPDSKTSDEYTWNYRKHDVTFYLSEDGHVTDLGSDGKLYRGVTYTEVKKAFGKPTTELYAERERNVSLVYVIDKKYELVIQFRTDKNGKKLGIVGVTLQKAWR